jgi:3-hydroxyacyl-CoA dehydrogenase
MGSRIAAHLANAGIPTLLLDMVPEGAHHKNKLAVLAIENLVKSKPAAFYDQAFAGRITPGNLEEDLPKLSQCDWIIEAVAENLAIKHALLARVVPHLAPGALLTTNTSGLPIHQIASALPEAVKKRFFGTHFFNPPRYMQLLEIIPLAETDPGILSAFAAFGDRLLGKQVVLANDTPNFIANRIGVTVMFTAAALMLQQGLTIEEADALTGQVIGWPRTGTFRLADMVGIDVLAHVAANFPQGAGQNASAQNVDALKGHDFSRAINTETDGRALAHEENTPNFSSLLAEIVKRNWLGDKTRQGFYKKSRGADGKEIREVLDLKSLEYRPFAKANIPSLEMAKNAATLKERLRILLANDPAKDKAAAFLWPLLSTLWNFSADRIGEAANDAPSIDRAMRAGFNWEFGPFEMWDAAGVRSTVDRMKAMNLSVSPAVQQLLDSGNDHWYAPDGPHCFNPGTAAWDLIPHQPGHARIADYRRGRRPVGSCIVRSNSAASLVDIGDHIGCIELHSLKNAIGGDVVSLVSSVLRPDSDAVRDFAGFVISGDRDNFSVGANLMQLLLAAQEGDWDEVNGAIRAFQQMTQAIKFCPRPVVAAPFGMTFGGGAEMCLHAARRQPHAETYIGLVEAGVGLIPGGGGTKEMLLRAVDAAAAVLPPDPRGQNPGPARFAQSAEMLNAIRRAFETIAMAKVSTSAVEGHTLGLFTSRDRITSNRERLLVDAKSHVQALIAAGYTAPVPRTDIPAPGLAALATMEMGVFLMGEAGYVSEHDQKVARWAAYILAGGRVTPGSLVSEQYLLDLEREAFLSLCGERKTLERIAFTLKTGKPLRN